jgi:hypothetical protein
MTSRIAEFSRRDLWLQKMMTRALLEVVAGSQDLLVISVRADELETNRQVVSAETHWERYGRKANSVPGSCEVGPGYEVRVIQ